MNTILFNFVELVMNDREFAKNMRDTMLLSSQTDTVEKEPEPKQKGKVVVALGLSGAGKDTFARRLNHRELFVHNKKFAGLAKRTFEEWYDLPRYALDTPEYKAETIPGTGKTYLQMLEDAYHAWDTIDPLLTVRPTIRDIEWYVRSEEHVIITDMRKTQEAGALIELVNNEELDMAVVLLHRIGCEALSTDLKLLDIFSILLPWASHSEFLVNLEDEEVLDGSVDKFRYDFFGVNKHAVPF